MHPQQSLLVQSPPGPSAPMPGNPSTDEVGPPAPPSGRGVSDGGGGCADNGGENTGAAAPGLGGPLHLPPPEADDYLSPVRQGRRNPDASPSSMETQRATLASPPPNPIPMAPLGGCSAGPAPRPSPAGSDDAVADGRLANDINVAVGRSPRGEGGDDGEFLETPVPSTADAAAAASLGITAGREAELDKENAGLGGSNGVGERGIGCGGIGRPSLLTYSSAVGNSSTNLLSDAEREETSSAAFSSVKGRRQRQQQAAASGGGAGGGGRSSGKSSSRVSSGILHRLRLGRKRSTSPKAMPEDDISTVVTSNPPARRDPPGSGGGGFSLTMRRSSSTEVLSEGGLAGVDVARKRASSTSDLDIIVGVEEGAATAPSGEGGAALAGAPGKGGIGGGGGVGGSLKRFTLRSPRKLLKGEEKAGLLGKGSFSSDDRDESPGYLQFRKTALASALAASASAAAEEGAVGGSNDVRKLDVSPPHSQLQAATGAAMLAKAGAAATTMDDQCPLTPTQPCDPSAHPLPLGILDTPPASSSKPLIVSAKKLGSEVRRKHGAKRRKGSSRRTKKARRKAGRDASRMGYTAVGCGAGGVGESGVGPRRLATGSPARTDAAAAATEPSIGVEEEDGMTIDDGDNGAAAGFLQLDDDGCTRVEGGRRTVEVERGAETPPTRRTVGFSVDDSFDSVDSDDERGVNREGGIENHCGSVSEKLREMDLSTTSSSSNTPLSTSSSVLAHKDGTHGKFDRHPRDISMDMELDVPGPPSIERRAIRSPEGGARSRGGAGDVLGAFPTGPSNGAFPTADVAPPSPSSSLSGSECSGDEEERCPFLEEGRAPRDGGASSSDDDEGGLYSNSDSETDTDDDDSTVCIRGYPPLPRPPESATQDERSRFYWEICYGAPPPLPPSGRNGAGGGADGLCTIAGSWSAGRVPPAKSCLSSKKKPSSLPKSGLMAAHSTPTLCDRFNFNGGQGQDAGAGRGGTSVMFNPSPLANEEIDASIQLTPTNTNGTFSVDQDTDVGQEDSDQKKPKLNVKFGTPSAAEFDEERPTVELTPLPLEVAKERFPVEEIEESEEIEVMHKATVENTAMLSEWEETFDSLLEDESDEGAVDGDDDDDSNASASSEGSSNAGEDWIPRSRPKRPKKKKRRRSRHGKEKDSRDERRSSNFFFSPGGGSLLDGDDEDVKAEGEQQTAAASSPDATATVTRTLGSFSPPNFSPEASLDQNPASAKDKIPNVDIEMEAAKPPPTSHRTDFVSPTTSESAALTATPHSEHSSTSLLQNVHCSGGAISLATTVSSPPKEGSYAVQQDEKLRPNSLGSVLDSCCSQHEDDANSRDHVAAGEGNAGAEDIHHHLLRMARIQERGSRVDEAITDFLRSLSHSEDIDPSSPLDLTGLTCAIDSALPSVPPVSTNIRAGLRAVLLCSLSRMQQKHNGISHVKPSQDPTAIGNIVADATATEKCSHFLRIALYEWRSHELKIMEEMTQVLRTWADKCDEELATMDRLLSHYAALLEGQKGRQKLIQSRIDDEFCAVEKLQAAFDSESRILEVYLKRKGLSAAQHEAAHSSVPKISYQLLSSLVPVQITYLSEDALESTFQNSDGSSMQIRWTINCGSNDVTNSPTAIQDFAISCHTTVLETHGALSDTAQRFHEALFLQSDTGKCADSMVKKIALGATSIDRYIVDQAKRETSFPSAFIAVGDLLSRIKLMTLDIVMLEERAELEVVLADSMVGLLVKISRAGGISLGVQFIYDQVESASAKFLPVAVSVISLGSDIPNLKELQAVSDSILKKRQLCNASLLNEIYDAIIPEIDFGV